MSINVLSGDATFQAIIFGIAIFSAMMLLIGWKTRLFTVISWFLLASINTRNPLVLQAGDILFRCLLFWSIFMPWGERFSVDSFKNNNLKSATGKLFSIGAFAFMLQVVFMYFFTALIKNHPVWTEDYNAIYYALSMDQFSWFLGPLIYQHQELMKIMTFSVFWVELIVPLFFFFPYRNSFFRFSGILIIGSFQTGLLLTMWLGLFPLISLSSLVIFIPSGFWDRFCNIEGTLDSIYRRLTGFISSSLDLLPNFQFGIRTDLKKYSRVITVFVALLLIYVFYWNLTTLNKSPISLPYGTHWMARVFRIDQKWNMFAPHPVTNDGWFVVIGRLYNGDYIDLLSNSEYTSISRPKDFRRQFQDYRWRKYLRNLLLNEYKEDRPYYGEFLCKKWNSSREKYKHLVNVEMFYMEERNLPDYRTAKVQKKFLFKHKCGQIL